MQAAESHATDTKENADAVAVAIVLSKEMVADITTETVAADNKTVAK